MPKKKFFFFYVGDHITNLLKPATVAGFDFLLVFL